MEMTLQTYSKLHMMNFLEFSNSLKKTLSNLSHNVSNNQFEAVKNIIIKNKYTTLASTQKVPDNPYSESLKYSEESIKNLIMVITWQKMAMDIMLTGWEKLIQLVGESKDIQHDKIKSDLEKENRADLLVKQKEMYESVFKLMKGEMEDLKIQNKELMIQMQKIFMKVEEIDKQEDKRYEETRQQPHQNPKLIVVQQPEEEFEEVEEVQQSQPRQEIRVAPGTQLYSIADKEKAVDRVRKGESMSRVAKDMGVSFTSVSLWCQKAGVESQHSAIGREKTVDYSDGEK